MAKVVGEINETWSERAQEEFEEYSIEEDYVSNMPCDFSGYCAGTSCPRYFECQK